MQNQMPRAKKRKKANQEIGGKKRMYQAPAKENDPSAPSKGIAQNCLKTRPSTGDVDGSKKDTSDLVHLCQNEKTTWTQREASQARRKKTVQPPKKVKTWIERKTEDEKNKKRVEKREKLSAPQKDCKTRAVCWG